MLTQQELEVRLETLRWAKAIFLNLNDNDVERRFKQRIRELEVVLEEDE